jgi:DNA replication protein DnaC
MSDVLHMAQLDLPDTLGGVRIGELAALTRPDHPFNELVESECSQKCGTMLKVTRYFAPITACDECRKKAEKADVLDKCKAYWESICPESFRKTDKEHPKFPKAQYAATASFCGNESLLFFGPSQVGKTRLAMLLLKRCLVRFNKHVGVLFEEDLESVKTFQDRKQLIMKWGRFDLLLMDDALLSSARDERTTGFLKQLLDYRMRYERHSIITSQVGGDDYKDTAKKDGLIRKQDEARVDALLKRVRETFRLVSFVEATPTPNTEEQGF